MSFNGFPEEFVDFLFSLQLNNTIALLPQNKIKYKELITEPLTHLYNDLVPVVSSISDSIIVRPSKCISSMYSDMRFSRETPLKGYMYLRFREPFSDKDILGFYFDMGCEHYSCGIRIYKQTSSGMEKIRQSVLVNRESFAHELDQLSRLDMKIYGDSFTKDRYTDINDDMIKGFLNKKSFYIGCNRDISSTVYCNELAVEISDAFRALGGLYSLIKNSLYR